MDANLIKNLKKDLIELRSQIWDKMSDAQKEQYYQDEANNAISVENIISFLH
jgi:hypothetical protein